MTRRFGKLAKSMLAIVFALVLAVGGLSIAVSANVVDEEFTVTTAQGINVRDTHSPNGTHRGALARNSVVRVDRRVSANGFEWVRISRVITRASGSTGATNAQMVGRWMAVRNTSNGALFANRTTVHGIIHSPLVSPTTGTPQTRFHFTVQTTHPVPNNHRVYLSIVGQNWGSWRMNGSNNNRTWTQNLHPFPVGTHTARITIVDANGREFTSANIGTFRVDNNTSTPANNDPFPRATQWSWPVAVRNNGTPRITTYGYWGRASSTQRGHSRYRRNHLGMDLVGPNNERNVAVFSAANGRVDYVRRTGTDANGRLVIIEHRMPNGATVWTLYSHLARVDVSRNDIVSPSTQIGVMGNSGLGTNALGHLHFQISNHRNMRGWHDIGFPRASNVPNRVRIGNNQYFFNPTFVINNNRLP